MIRSRCSCDRPPWSAAASRPRPGQRLREVVHLAPGPGEHERRGAVLEVEDPAERRELVRRAGRRMRPGGRGPPRPRRAASASTWTRTGWRRWRRGEPRDRPGDGRGEQRRLARLAERPEDLLEVVGEAHVEHLVGLVEDDGVDLVEAERAAVEVVDRAARRRDDDVDAAREPVELGRDRLAAVDRDDPDAELLAVLVDRLGDLHRELARRREHERPSDALPRPSPGDAAAVDRAAGRAVLVEADGEPLEDRQRERGGLAGAGRRLGEQVLARQQRRDRRRWTGVGSS